ncbi:MAG: hypothetical protein JSR79_02275 [Proteobacteria bacterium]|nr:hypothetical protein [Pseudomonadota bacterium]
MRFKLMALAAAVSFAVPAIAQTPSDAATPAPKKEKKTCRRYAVTGSIIGTRAECHTQAEWAAIDAANARNVDDTLGSARPGKTLPN